MFESFFNKVAGKNICERVLLYLHIILFTAHEKDTANEARLNIYDVVFLQNQLTTYYFHRKVLS